MSWSPPELDEETQADGERLIARLRAREAALNRLEHDLDRVESRFDAMRQSSPASGDIQVELLRQTASLAERLDHTRTAIDNVDRKLEAFAADVLQTLSDRARSPWPTVERHTLQRGVLIAAAVVAAIALWWLVLP